VTFSEKLKVTKTFKVELKLETKSHQNFSNLAILATYDI